MHGLVSMSKAMRCQVLNIPAATTPQSDSATSSIAQHYLSKTSDKIIIIAKHNLGIVKEASQKPSVPPTGFSAFFKNLNSALLDMFAKQDCQ